MSMDEFDKYEEEKTDGADLSKIIDFDTANSSTAKAKSTTFQNKVNLIIHSYFTQLSQGGRILLKLLVTTRREV